MSESGDQRVHNINTARKERIACTATWVDRNLGSVSSLRRIQVPHFFLFFRSRINSMLCHQISQCCELDMMMTEEEEEKKSSRETSWWLETFLLPLRRLLHCRRRRRCWWWPFRLIVETEGQAMKHVNRYTSEGSWKLRVQIVTQKAQNSEIQIVV